MSELQKLKRQNILTTQLGEQAIEALSVLLAAFQKKWQIYIAEIAEEEVGEIYDGISLLLLRKLLGLYAKKRDLLWEGDNRFQIFKFSEKYSQKMTKIFQDLSWISAEEQRKIQIFLTQINQENIDYGQLDIEQLGSVYEQIMELSLEKDNLGNLRLIGDEKRRDTGAHYTPRILCTFTIQQAVSRILPENPSSKDILALRVCDPAMGSGAFLIAVLRQLSDLLVEAWRREGKRNTDIKAQAKILIAETCLFGVDINPRATQLAQLSIWLEVGRSDFSLDCLESRLLTGNALLDSRSGEFDAGENSFAWREQFPTVFLGEKKGFDIIVGNPPFINCIRGRLDPFVKAFIKKRYPIITGSADLSYYFLELSTEIIHENGIIGLILPRVSMGAKALRRFRMDANRPKPFLMYSAEHYDFFYNADIKTVIYILGNAQSTLVSNAVLPTKNNWYSIPLENPEWWESYQGNWWIQFSLTCSREEMPETKGAKALKALGFEVHGGLTTDDFYQLQVEESPYGAGLKLLTSGGIDPNQSFWGKEGNYQKFRKQNFRFPRIVKGEYSCSLERKLERSRRPKIIVANLTKELEAFLDVKGEYQGATATQTIYHQNDSVEKLQELCEVLHSDYGNLLFHHVLRYNAMHSNISVEKEFLLEFPVLKNHTSEN